MVIRENYLAKIRPFIGKDIIKVLTGIRRGGKSVLLEQIRDEIGSPNTIVLNFEDLGNQRLCEYNALHDYVCEKIGDNKEQFYLFFDEIQEVQGWENAVNSLRVKFHADIYITGSNSWLLSGELATYIAGRYISFVVYPFSFTEFQMADPGLTFHQYIQYGGMPFLSSINFKAENRTVAPETILNYLKACEEAYLLYRFKSQDINGKKVLKVNEKYYAADHGLREAVIGANLQNVEIILENIVGLELLRRGYKVCVGRVGTKEIDFVGEKQGDKLYIQVCCLLSDEAAIQREFGPLLEVRDNYPKIVLYQEGSFRGNYEGIPAMRIEDWLMEEVSKHGQ